MWSTYSIPEQASAGAHFLVTAGQIGSQNYSVWTVRTAFAAQHPAVVQAFYQYLHDEGLKEIQNPAPFINVFTTSGPQAVNGTAERLTSEDFAKGATTSPISAKNVADFNAVAQFFADQKITPTKVTVDPYVLSLPGSGT